MFNSKINIKLIFIIAAMLLSFQGCLKDNVSPTVSVNLETSALVLRYFEEQGDYINSNQMPSVVNPDEVNNHLNTYLIIDIRNQAEYIAGHIPGAYNVANDSLLNFMNERNALNFPKVIIVSDDGQSASYYTCLLRLYGYNNVYALLFGMAEWNQDFSAIWQNNDSYYTGYVHFTNKRFPLNKISPLPSVNLNGSSQNLEEKVKDRISNLISQGFKYDTNYVYFADIKENIKDYYLTCFGRDSLYYHNKEGEPGSGHFPNTVYYNPAFDLRSTLNLQTFPTDRKILIYSYSGHLSAFLAAYLRVMGYDAKTLMYGASKIFYFYLKAHLNVFSPFIFLDSNIKNYSYSTGIQPALNNFNR